VMLGASSANILLEGDTEITGQKRVVTDKVFASVAMVE
jgi:hypothetical protein